MELDNTLGGNCPQLCRLCQEHPKMLDVSSFKAALDEVKRLTPQLDISEALNTQPSVISSRML